MTILDRIIGKTIEAVDYGLEDQLILRFTDGTSLVVFGRYDATVGAKEIPAPSIASPGGKC